MLLKKELNKKGGFRGVESRGDSESYSLIRGMDDDAERNH